jgi:hypothetical protein
VSGPGRLRVQVLVGDLVVHEFSRSTSRPSADGVRRMSDAALGWLQAWSGQLAEDQWQADVRRAVEAQRLAEQHADASSIVPPQAA